MKQIAASIGAVSMLLLGISVANASILYGVIGDGGSPSETFYTVNTSTAAATFVQTLGNGNDGESIAFNPNDGLMYHWSGFSSHVTQVMETINLGSGVVSNVVQDFTSYDPVEVWGSTYDPSTGGFLVTDIEGKLSAVTPGGVWSTIGSVGDGDYRGIAFNGGSLYVGDKSSSQLDYVNALTGGTNSFVNVILGGDPVDGIIALTTDPISGVLYGILKANRGDRILATINPVTGAATNIGTLPFSGFANIEFSAVAVPEPSLIALFGLGLAGLGFARRRRLNA